MFSLDTEVTGLDIYHGNHPYFVTTCDDKGNHSYWEWRVDPLTRKVAVNPADVQEIQERIDVVASWGSWSEDVAERHGMVLHNAKFDCTALEAIGIVNWPWNQVYDTLLASHLLASNLPHDLTSLVIQYLGDDIENHEDELETACKKARDLCRRHLPNWRIAKEDLPEMPSAGKECWKADGWLPKELCLWAQQQRQTYVEPEAVQEFTKTGRAKKLKEPVKPWWWEYGEENHPWLTVLANYANADSASTMALWLAMRSEIKRRGLEKIFAARRKVLYPIHQIEAHGVTCDLTRLNQLQEEYATEGERHKRICTNIAASMGYELTMPKSGNNASLLEFCFGPKTVEPVVGEGPAQRYLNLPLVVKTDKGAPSLNKAAMEAYAVTLDPRSKQGRFIASMITLRKCATAVTYMDGYRAFGLPTGDGMLLMHPFLNPTGTATLRCSSASPNGQNVQKKDTECPRCDGDGCDNCNGTGKTHRSPRYCFGPAPGREWWSLDAKNIELRIPAYVSGEQELINLFEHPDDPPYYGSNHLLNFHTVYPDIWEKELAEVGWEKVGPHCKKRYASTWYQYCKNGGFGVQYGAVDKADGTGTADRAFHRPGSHRLLKKRFSSLEKLNQRCIQQANKQGYVETLPDRTVDPKRGYPLLCTRTDFGRVLETVPLNYLTQGSACWWMMRAMIRCQQQLDDWHAEDGFTGRMVLQVHDELVFDFPKAGHPQNSPETSNLWRIRKIQELMAQGGNDLIPSVPTPVGCEYHENNWSEGITL